MRSMFRSACLVLVLAHAALAQPSTGSLTGRVVDVMTGAPIDGAVVSLAPLSPGLSPRPLTGQTNAEGVFIVVGIPEGRWRVNVQKTGFYVVGGSGQALAIDVKPAAVVEAEIPMDRGGAIDGRVLDAKGNPVSDVMVTAVQRTPPGDRPPGPVPGPANVQTNDLGHFRLAGLPPGEYYLVVRPRPAPLTSAAVASPTNFVQNYYPGVADMVRATPLVVSRGVTTSALDWPMLAVATYQVSGVVLDPDGRPAPGATVQLVPGDPQTPRGAPLVATARPDGAFRIVNVPAGSYLVGATLASKLESSRVQRLVVESADVTGLQVAIVK